MLTSFITVFALSAATPEVVFSGQRVQLTPLADPVVVRARSHEAIRSRLPNAHMQRIMGELTVIDGAPSVAPELIARGIASEVLAVYATTKGERLFADRHVRVRFAPSVSQAEAQRLVAQAGGSNARIKVATRNEYEALAATSAEAVDFAERLGSTRNVVWAHPDFIQHVELASAATDPLYASQYHHQILNSAAAWDVTRGSPQSIIAVLDSGTDITHPEFANKIVSPYDFLDDDADASPAGDDAHGTACSGIAAAAADNGIGIAGVCPGCSLMPVRMLDEDGHTRQGGAADAITWAVTHGARTISCSWSLSPVPSSLSDALASADAAGAILLFASGNSSAVLQSTDVAANPHVHAVGATTEYDAIAGYSNTGAELFITAPSPSIVTDISSERGYTNGAYYNNFAGTSGSTPAVAGLAGLILSQRPELTNTQVLEILSSTADKVGTVEYVDGRNDIYGAGRISSYRAMLVAANLTPCVPEQEICDNGLDEDCDGLVDTLDPQCAPADIPLGAPCTKDFQCSLRGFCLFESLGYPSGYCTSLDACGGTGSVDCPPSSVCIGEGYATGSQCHLRCEDDTGCRAGYFCRTFATGDKACVPSCETSSCLAGETCDPETKRCVHAGPSPVGGACTSRVECANNGRCLDDFSGYYSGFCVTECQDSSVCPSGSSCYVLSEGTAFCFPTCSVLWKTAVTSTRVVRTATEAATAIWDAWRTTAAATVRRAMRTVCAATTFRPELRLYRAPTRSRVRRTTAAARAPERHPSPSWRPWSSDVGASEPLERPGRRRPIAGVRHGAEDGFANVDQVLRARGPRHHFIGDGQAMAGDPRHIEGEAHQSGVTGVKQAIVRLACQAKCGHTGHRAGRRNRWDLAEQLDFAKQSGAVELGKSPLFPLRIALGDRHFAARCDVERVGRVTLAEDGVAGAERHGRHEVNEGHQGID
jgi:subtilisin family serine protease